MEKIEALLQAHGWVLECYSPLEISQTEDGVQVAFASGRAAQRIIAQLETETPDEN